MLSVLRWSGRVVFVLLLLASAGVGFGLWKFERWREAKVESLDGGSRIVQTAAGAIECATAGDGPAVLICHGAPGGYDQALRIGQPLEKAGFKVIAPSRPGFLRTPLGVGLTFTDQADALAALLDALGVARVVVVGYSSGAQVAAIFAERHAGRTAGLVLISPISAPYAWDPFGGEPKRKAHPIESALMKLTGDIGAWWLAREASVNPRSAAAIVLEHDSTLGAAERDRLAAQIADDPVRREWLAAMVGTFVPLSSRESGTRNDLLMLRNLRQVPFDTLTAPMLVVLGLDDAAAPWVDVASTFEKAQTVNFVKLRESGHLVWLAPEARQFEERLRAFVATEAGR